MLYLKRLQNISTRNQRLTIGAFRSGTDNISLAVSSKHHENQWDYLLLDPNHLHLYQEANDLKQFAFSRVKIAMHDDATKSHIEQIMDNITDSVEAITITKGTVDWKYARRFSFTSATAHVAVKVVLKQLWPLCEDKPHWRAVTSYLDSTCLLEPDVDDEYQPPEEEEENQGSDNEEERVLPETIPE